MHYPVPELSKAELVEGLKELLQRERRSLLDTIEWMIYVNYYKPFIEEGYYSLCDYLERGFGMSPNQAFKRHTVVRQIDYFPDLMRHLADNKTLNITVVTTCCTPCSSTTLPPGWSNVQTEWDRVRADGSLHCHRYRVWRHHQHR